ncbi:MAG: 30S ribosomal protein S3 [Candidatus Marsarchaeota archaeon]|jgi:small subunit ribosomal protein S3|nr:30S ribosomal protein S3 [Candidatus Marsarchaeota archaeon]MCL5111705.1 30S ribosomal protein S3 [Candidatus Marsarchaeota archaeon]
MAIERRFIDDSIIKYNVSKYLSKELVRAGFSRVEIQKTPVLTRITVYVLSPGRVIGRAGKTIDALTENIKNMFKVDNPQINVMEVENKMLEPMLVAREIAEKFERGINARRVIQSMLKSILDNGAIGAEIIASGKLAAKGARAKTIRKSVGYMPKAGDVTNLVREAHATAYPKYGAIGVKVRIVPPGTVFPGVTMKPIEVPKSILNS